MLELQHGRVRDAVGLTVPAHRRRAGLHVVALLATSVLLLSVGAMLVPDASSPASAATDPVTVFLRVEGPAHKATFGQTGEYETVWSGEVEVPREVTITATSGKQYRLFVEGGRYKSIRLDSGRIEDLGAADDSLGATSVLAALHAASQLGGFSYQVTDNFYPGQGFFVTSVGGVTGSGAVGWSYRVWNDDLVASPQVSVERFLLGYDSADLALPHREALFYWGYATRCLPLRVTPLEASVRCGLPTQVLVEAFVDDAGPDGHWEAVSGASVCVGDECRMSDAGGVAELVLDVEGIHSVAASCGHVGDYYYVPADGRASVDVAGPCEVISFTLWDHGVPGINFGNVAPGTASAPERDQTAGDGAVTLVVGVETSIDCVLQLRGSGGLSGDGMEIPLSGITWGLDNGGANVTSVTTDYITVAQAPADVATSIDVWHWLTVPVDQPYGVYAGQFYYRVTGEPL